MRFPQIISQSLLFRETLKLQCGDSCLQKQTGAKRNQQPSLVKEDGRLSKKKRDTHSFTHTLCLQPKEILEDVGGDVEPHRNNNPSDVSSDFIPSVN